MHARMQYHSQIDAMKGKELFEEVEPDKDN